MNGGQTSIVCTGRDLLGLCALAKRGEIHIPYFDTRANGSNALYKVCVVNLVDVPQPSGNLFEK